MTVRVHNIPGYCLQQIVDFVTHVSAINTVWIENHNFEVQEERRMADSAEADGQPAQPVADQAKFEAYLSRCVPVLLEDTDTASPAFKAALKDRQNAEQLKKFLGDPQSPTLLIQRSSTKGL